MGRRAQARIEPFTVLPLQPLPGARPTGHHAPLLLARARAPTPQSFHHVDDPLPPKQTAHHLSPRERTLFNPNCALVGNPRYTFAGARRCLAHAPCRPCCGMHGCTRLAVSRSLPQPCSGDDVITSPSLPMQMRGTQLALVPVRSTLLRIPPAPRRQVRWPVAGWDQFSLGTGAPGRRLPP